MSAIPLCCAGFISWITVALSVVAVARGATTNDLWRPGVAPSQRMEKGLIASAVKDPPTAILIAMQDFSDSIDPVDMFGDDPTETNDTPDEVLNSNQDQEGPEASPIQAPPATTVNIVVNLDHNGQFERLSCSAEEVAYRVTFPHLTREFRLSLPAARAFVVHQVWVLSDTLDIDDFNHRIDAVINDKGALVITVRAFSKPGDSRLANTGTADFDHYTCLAARLGDLSFRVLLK